MVGEDAERQRPPPPSVAAFAATAATAASREASAVDARFRVLPSGVLGFRMPDTKAGKPVWLDVVKRVKLCPCGHSMTQMHHWRCAARPRAKPSWVACQCDAKGLYTDLKAKPSLPEGVAVPPYASVLWRDGTPKRLQPMNVLAVKVPGKPKEHEVWIDAEGRARCAHGFTESALSKVHQERKRCAASKIQQWWRQLGRAERASVRAALLHAAPSEALKRAAAAWRRDSARRRAAPIVHAGAKRARGRAAVEPCGCRPGGLRRDVFGTMQRASRTSRLATRCATRDSPLPPECRGSKRARAVGSEDDVAAAMATATAAAEVPTRTGAAHAAEDATQRKRARLVELACNQ
ncbi:hypothetical protein EMIHUDRAFT_445534 [Emiliania huxleyi CCMP1516]|uniref:Uncharacterized protein n=2 Tax=Emiliania huxleyi TaxID=2903 RepID=A0A0D3IX19_EMIH1|nr:hypothetical protein EMIHUDRAFT_445534 [Emiliania huxleyi CCMP1516]EOD15804.1 hypothetical protein EMIHUDRAFT_445534 [Emiliania huxleyi CCMP1516]|eukprot:XP_005768233.1 hypothetical protein EMIHUDRAFT_445534 [Emiliania huxleyi CCMP1516]